MVRDLRRLADSRFDLLVIGAGVYGAATAWDAAQRGLSVALIDRGDFGGGTSFNNLKTLHGGLRSLQTLNLDQMRRFIRERRALARIAPHLVRPLPFIVPTTGVLRRSRVAMQIALAINDLIARDRNEGIRDRQLHLPDSQLVSKDDALRLNPYVAPAGVTGGAVWYDYQMTNADRMTFAFARSAVAAGTAAANYVEATRLLLDSTRIVGAEVRDRFSREAFAIRAAVVVNAAGAWAPTLLRSLPDSATAVPAPLLSRAMNLVLDRPVGHHACGGVAHGRFLFLVPWRDGSILGTSHDAHAGDPDDLTVSEKDVDDFLEEGRAAFPGAELGRENVRLVHRGLLPMVAGRGRHVTLLRESTVVDHAAHNAPGLVSIHGVRYTTARHTAQQAVDTAFRVLGHAKPPSCQTDRTVLTGGDITDVATFIDRSRESTHLASAAAAMPRLVGTYGTEYRAVVDLAASDTELAAPIGAGCTVSAAEILYAARHEMACTLTDALIRRTEAGSAGHPGPDAIERAADILAREHEWTDERKLEEMAAVERFYELPAPGSRL